MRKNEQLQKSAKPGEIAMTGDLSQEDMTIGEAGFEEERISPLRPDAQPYSGEEDDGDDS